MIIVLRAGVLVAVVVGMTLRVLAVVRVVPVLKHEPHRLQIDVPRRRAPSGGEQYGEKCAETRHRRQRVHDRRQRASPEAHRARGRIREWHNCNRSESSRFQKVPLMPKVRIVPKVTCCVMMEGSIW